MTTTPHRGDAAPGHLLCLTEPARAAFDYTLLASEIPLPAAPPPGDRHPVPVLPRMHATDASTSTLRTVLKQLGYRTYGWQLDRSISPTSKVMHGMRARLDYLTNRHQRPATVIGCSLGGIYARQLARRTPQAVRQVITPSSPIRLAPHEQSPRQPAVSSLRPPAHRAREFAARTRRRAAPVPATSIYTPLDGIVARRTCPDQPSPRTEKIAVRASHLGIANQPAAPQAIADRLAQPADPWKPFQPRLSCGRLTYLATGG